MATSFVEDTLFYDPSYYGEMTEAKLRVYTSHQLSKIVEVASDPDFVAYVLGDDMDRLYTQKVIPNDCTLVTLLELCVNAYLNPSIWF